MPESQPTVAVLGTWGYYGLLDDAEQVQIDTPYGPTSDHVVAGSAGGRKLAYLTRTGRHRNIPPHRINARANIWALHSLGVRTILAPTPSGSLRPAIGVGSIVVPDQLVDRTGRTDDTFHDDDACTCPSRTRSASADAEQWSRRSAGTDGWSTTAASWSPSAGRDSPLAQNPAGTPLRDGT